MLTRENLEQIKPVRWSRPNDKALVLVPLPAEDLLVAAPALALACLEAWDLIYLEPAGSEREMALDDLMAKLEKALAAAGVEVPQ